MSPFFYERSHYTFPIYYPNYYPSLTSFINITSPIHENEEHADKTKMTVENFMEAPSLKAENDYQEKCDSAKKRKDPYLSSQLSHFESSLSVSGFKQEDNLEKIAGIKKEEGEGVENKLENACRKVKEYIDLKEKPDIGKIAEVYEVNENTLRSRLRRLGITLIKDTRKNLELALQEAQLCLAQKKKPNLQAIAKKFGVKAKTLGNNINKLGITLKDHTLTQDDDLNKTYQEFKRRMDLHEEPNVREVAQEFGVTERSLRARMGKLGVTLIDHKIENLELAYQAVMNCKNNQDDYSIQEIAKEFGVNRKSLANKIRLSAKRTDLPHKDVEKDNKLDKAVTKIRFLMDCQQNYNVKAIAAEFEVNYKTLHARLQRLKALNLTKES